MKYIILPIYFIIFISEYAYANSKFEDNNLDYLVTDDYDADANDYYEPSDDYDTGEVGSDPDGDYADASDDNCEPNDYSIIDLLYEIERFEENLKISNIKDQDMIQSLDEIKNILNNYVC